MDSIKILDALNDMVTSSGEMIPPPSPPSYDLWNEDAADLLEHERRFLEEFMLDLDRDAARHRCGMSKREVNRLMASPQFQAARNVEQMRLRNEWKIEEWQIIRELAAIAFSTVANFKADDDGNLIGPPMALRAVKSVKTRVKRLRNGDIERETEYTLWNKTEALKMLANMLGFMRDKPVEASIPCKIYAGFDLTEILERARNEKNSRRPLLEAKPISLMEDASTSSEISDQSAYVQALPDALPEKPEYTIQPPADPEPLPS